MLPTFLEYARNLAFPQFESTAAIKDDGRTIRGIVAFTSDDHLVQRNVCEQTLSVHENLLCVLEKSTAATTFSTFLSATTAKLAKPRTTPSFTVYPVRPTTPMGDLITTTIKLTISLVFLSLVKLLAAARVFTPPSVC
ncbi:hypothetical protein NECAME_09807 [Necator americanus]|uniref:Uncharacterized protein n=1 Tax=Necator americanus TaxID=51031 RepID=W2TBM2_NECAM|nr:hypothetical protein NECAME_09807 [Necator americanus]ETN79440.1 hypothetical protein NECAME_09807 [Necator americanus]